MKIFHVGFDGGPKSPVTGYWLIELKKLFSIALLKFRDGSRDAYHSHAFNCVSWVLRGRLREEHLDGIILKHRPSFRPVITKRSTFHRVFSEGTTWVFTVRGPWAKRWSEYNPGTRTFTSLENGRVIITARQC